MNEGLRNRIQACIDRLRKKAGDVGPMHGSWDDIFDLEAILRANNWQPIETAPRDGAWVLLKGGTLTVDSPFEGGDMQPPAVVAKWIHDPHPHSASDVCGVAHWDSDWRTQYQNPTHWRPAPE